MSSQLIRLSEHENPIKLFSCIDVSENDFVLYYSVENSMILNHYQWSTMKITSIVLPSRPTSLAIDYCVLPVSCCVLLENGKVCRLCNYEVLGFFDVHDVESICIGGNNIILTHSDGSNSCYQDQVMKYQFDFSSWNSSNKFPYFSIGKPKIMAKACTSEYIFFVDNDGVLYIYEMSNGELCMKYDLEPTHEIKSVRISIIDGKFGYISVHITYIHKISHVTLLSFSKNSLQVFGTKHLSNIYSTQIHRAAVSLLYQSSNPKLTMFDLDFQEIQSILMPTICEYSKYGIVLKEHCLLSKGGCLYLSMPSFVYPIYDNKLYLLLNRIYRENILQVNDSLKKDIFIGKSSLEYLHSLASQSRIDIIHELQLHNIESWISWGFHILGNIEISEFVLTSEFISSNSHSSFWSNAIAAWVDFVFEIVFSFYLLIQIIISQNLTQFHRIVVQFSRILDETIDTYLPLFFAKESGILEHCKFLDCRPSFELFYSYVKAQAQYIISRAQFMLDLNEISKPDMTIQFAGIFKNLSDSQLLAVSKAYKQLNKPEIAEKYLNRISKKLHDTL